MVLQFLMRSSSANTDAALCCSDPFVLLLLSCAQVPHSAVWVHRILIKHECGRNYCPNAIKILIEISHRGVHQECGVLPCTNIKVEH